MAKSRPMRDTNGREVVAIVTDVLRAAVLEAPLFRLHTLLKLDGTEARPPAVEELWEGRAPEGLRVHQAWGDVYKWRCGLTFDRRMDLIWLEDKVEQRRLMGFWPPGAAEPLPSAWFDSAEEAEAEAARRLSTGEPVVVKPRHAASGQGMAILRPGLEADSGEASDAPSSLIREALTVECKQGETWQLYQVPKGVGLEPLYPSLGMTAREPDRPLELKVQTVWGRCIGACLHTSQEVWVLPDGRLHRWQGEFKSLHKCALRKKYGPLPPHMEETLEPLLREHWSFLVSESEAIARRWGLDEVRVDWFLGCPRFGPRVCEVTWMGTGGRLPRPLQLVVAKAFFEGHRRRLELESQGQALPDLDTPLACAI